VGRRVSFGHDFSRLNRRKFIALSGAFALAGATARQNHATEPSDFFSKVSSLGLVTALQFEWDSAAKQLTVYEVVEASDDNLRKINERAQALESASAKDEEIRALWSTLKLTPTWVVDVASLDPEIDAILSHPKSGEPMHVIRLRLNGLQRFAELHENAAGTTRVVELHFHQKTAPTEAQSLWTVEVLSDCWSKPGSKKAFGSINFSELYRNSSLYPNGEKLIFQSAARSTTSAKEAVNALQEYVGRQVEATGLIAAEISYHLRRFQWNLKPVPGDRNALTCFGQQMAIRNLTGPDWQRESSDDQEESEQEKADEKSPTKRKQTVGFAADGDHMPASADILFGLKNGMHVHLGTLPKGVNDTKDDQAKPALPATLRAEITRSDTELACLTVLEPSEGYWKVQIASGRPWPVDLFTAVGKITRRQEQTEDSSSNELFFRVEARLFAIDANANTAFELNMRHLSKPEPFYLGTYLGRLKVAPADIWVKVEPDKEKKVESKDKKEGGKESPPKSKTIANPVPEVFVGGVERRFPFEDHAVPASAWQRKLEDIHVRLSLLEAPFALKDSTTSQLLFDHSSLALIYTLKPQQLPASYVWLDHATAPRDGMARFDLTRGQLMARNARELLALKFRFADLALVFHLINSAGKQELSPPQIESLPENCRVIVRSEKSDFRGDGITEQGGIEIQDNRPRLVVEFPPQHVFEEAIFRPAPQGPPTLALKPGKLSPEDTPELLALKLARIPDRTERSKERAKWAEAIEKKYGSEDEFKQFKEFAELYNERARFKNLPVDQLQYIGPFALEPDAFAVARQLAIEQFAAKIETFIKELSERVLETRAALLATGKEYPEEPAERRRFEGKLEAEHALYGVFRSWFAEARLFDTFAPGKPLTTDGAEFWLKDGDAAKLASAMNNDGFRDVLTGKGKLLEQVRARLSRPSRLVFAINCNTETHEAGPPALPNAAIAYSLAALTNWADHELVVVRKAQTLHQPDRHGLLGPMDKRLANSNEKDILLFQGIKPSPFGLVQQRLAEVAANLAKAPSGLETAIEIPSRLVLSPSQEALWFSPRNIDRLWVYSPLKGSADFRQHEAGIGNLVQLGLGEELRPTGVDANLALWTARLDVDSVNPRVRAVYSPDFRPEALFGKYMQSANGYTSPPNNLGLAPPPKGPFAPWYLGREVNDSGVMDVNAEYNRWRAAVDPKAPVADDVCEVIAQQENLTGEGQARFSFPSLFDYLCGRRKPPLSVATDAAFFRSTLDAYDRHELVMLTSAHGLPVQKRGDAGQPQREDAEQFDPPDGYVLLDAMDEQAIYRPKTLSLRELTLTSMGGSFRHDTTFQPPTAVATMLRKRAYDSLSIERWQHWTVLGRDIVVEVVYKGFLFPLGIRAALVKLTERTFIKSPKGHVKAYLRQRMFLRCANPVKSYPALRQPNGGRQFPCKTLELLTLTTPDIVDPTRAVAPVTQEPSFLRLDLNGRLTADPQNFPGLVFWPKTDLTPNGFINFEFTVDNRKTKLPLIFIDNTAAQDGDVVSKVVDYYNKSVASPDADAAGKCKITPTAPQPDHKRTMLFAGQTLRYCEEIKVGDSSFDTDSWTLKAQGRNRPGGDKLEGDNTDYFADAQMQGADQPAFYPAVETARIRIRQVERFTGNASEARLVQYDGGYIKAGFRSQGNEAARLNALDVFLNLAEALPLSMGQQGDRSGGMYSPGSDIVALSRTNGPVGASIPESDSITTCGDLKDWSRIHIGFPPPPPAQQNEGATEEPADSAKSKIPEKVKVFKNYFSGDAKLLGVIRLNKLIEFLGIEVPDDPTELPLLSEVIEYGASAMHDADAAAGNITQFIKEKVLVPVRLVVRRLQTAWRDVQRRWNELRSQAPDETGALDLAKLFPEIGAGLTGLDSAITRALETEDAIDFALQLSEVYEAGRQLINGLERLADNAVARLEEGARGLLDQYFRLATEAYAEIKKLLEADIGEIKTKLRKRIADELTDAIPAPDPASTLVEELIRDLSGKVEDLHNLPDYESTVPDEVKAAVTLLWNALLALANEFKGQFEAGKFKTTVQKHIVALLDSLEGGKAFALALPGEIKAKYESCEDALKELSKALAVAVEAELETLADELTSPLFKLLTEMQAAINGVDAELKQQQRDANLVVQQALLVKGPDEGSIRALLEILRVLSDHLSPNVSQAIWRAASLLRKTLPLFDALKRKNSRDVVQSGLGLLAPIIGSYSTADVEQAVAPLVNAYAKVIAAQDAVLGEVIEVVTKADAGALQAVKGLNEKVYTGQDNYLTVLSNARNATKDLPSLPSEAQGLVEDFLVLVQVLEGQKPQWAAFEKLLEDQERLKDLRLTDQHSPKLWDLLDGKTRLVSVRTLDEQLNARLALLRKGGELALRLFKAHVAFTEKHAAVLVAAAVVAKALENESGDKVKAWKDKVEKDLKDEFIAVLEQTRSMMVSCLDVALTAMGKTDQAADGALEEVSTNIATLPSVLHTAVQGQITLLRQKVTGFKLARFCFEGLRKELDDFKGKFEGDKSLSNCKDLLIELQSIFTKAPEYKPVGQARTCKEIVEELLKQGPNQADALTIIELVPAAALRDLVSMGENLRVQFAEAAETELSKRALALGKLAADKSEPWPGLYEIYAAIARARGEALASLPSIIATQLRKRILVPPLKLPEGDLTEDNDQLSLDTRFLEKLKGLADPPTDEQVTEYLPELRKFATAWQTGNAAPLKVFEGAEDVLQMVIRGDILQLIDVSAIRNEIEQSLKQLVPLRANLGYKFGGPFEHPEKISDITAGIFAPEKGSGLSITTAIKVEFLQPKEPDLNVVGELGPFKIKLVGDFLDAVTINFSGARFTIQNGRNPKVEVFYKDYVIGRDLEFVQQLQAYLTPQKGSGFFLNFRFNPLGVEAGYGIALPILMLGTVSFSNISLNASLVIPFDGGDTRFRASLSRREAPFTISVLPYGGSGFFAVEANADGIIGFEASFEFGGAAAFQFGPLNGIGRLMLGFYIKQTKIDLGDGGTRNLVEIMGTFYCGGTATIWIFNFGASLYVRLGMSNGNMEGEATFTFSFSCGFADFDYSVKVKRKQNKMGGKDTGWINHSDAVQLAARGTADLMGTENWVPSPEYFPEKKRCNNTTCLGVDRAVYLRYFDNGLPKRVDKLLAPEGQFP
jgi:hypothetical protein